MDFVQGFIDGMITGEDPLKMLKLVQFLEPSLELQGLMLA